jgi:dTDP-glucose 4,6-dehydratase
MEVPETLMITGAAGFIGSHVVRHWSFQYPQTRLLCVDKLTYAGHKENLTGLNPNAPQAFEQVDITERDAVFGLFRDYNVDAVINLAAESHVDRSIANPSDFIGTNVLGTTTLLDAAIQCWNLDKPEKHLFFQVSTDEVFGTLGKEGYFREDTPYNPRSPYAASKASADHLVSAYQHTYGLPTKISNCSNNYGPYQFPEKLLPVMIYKIINRQPLPVYGKGENIRDWLYVEDHVKAIDQIFHHGNVGETYLVGGNNEWTNLELVYKLCQLMDEKLDKPSGKAAELISFVTDRAGHDYRYAMDPTKIQEELGWRPLVAFEDGLRYTIDWYMRNEAWVEAVTRQTA